MCTYFIAEQSLGLIFYSGIHCTVACKIKSQLKTTTTKRQFFHVLASLSVISRQLLADYEMDHASILYCMKLDGR